MVKPRHPIDEIPSRIKAATDNYVRLTRKGTSPQPEDDPRRILGAKGASAAASVIRALDEPLNYPPLDAATVPGDRVAIAVDENVPCVGEVVRGAVEALQSAGVEAEHVSVVTTDAITNQLCRQALSGGAEAPQVVTHDPDDEQNLCLVGQTRQREPLLINRAIFDADVVLPIGCARVGESTVYGTLFPRFSNAQALERFRAPLARSSQQDAEHQAREIDEAGWLVGAPMVVQVVPGADESITHVVAGEAEAVARRCDDLCRDLWSLQSPQRVSLVVATISGGAQTQRWANVGRALATAEQLLQEGGAVAICSNLEKAPGESLGRLIGSDDLESAERRIFRDHNEDSWPAWHLARALQRGPVYLLSQLDADTVEDLGLAPIADIAELVRLAGRHESCIVVEDSQHAVVTVGDSLYAT